jgi:hypothetical protein
VLEYWCYNNQHRDDYKRCAASKIPLHDDSCITTLECTAQEKEPECIAEAQTLKATGALSGIFLTILYALENNFMSLQTHTPKMSSFEGQLGTCSLVVEQNFKSTLAYKTDACS